MSKYWIIKNRVSGEIYTGFLGLAPRLYLQEKLAKTAYANMEWADKAEFDIVAVELREL